MGTGRTALPRLIPILDLDDPRLAPYARLKERDLAREGGRFLAEGELVVRRLLASPRCAVESLLVAGRRVAALAPAVPDHVPIYVAEPDAVNRIVGFKFHAGIMAVGLRPASVDVEALLAGGESQRWRLLVLPRISKTDNLGALIRIAAGLGTDGVLLGPECCDPYYRQAVRVSMGAVFDLPLARSADLARDLQRLRQAGVQRVAAVLGAGAEPLSSATPARRMAFLLGNEADGLRPEELALCDRRVTIPMDRGVDSLNVAVAAGIILHHFRGALQS
jgi:tRNA G18 (ribose-2'-O)-methylase SpoU